MKNFFTLRAHSSLILGASALALCLLSLTANAATIFTENMGSGTTTQSIATNTFQNSGTYTYSGTGDTRTSSASGVYAGASGGKNVFLTNTSAGIYFQMSGIVTTGYTNLSLSFGASKNLAVSNMTALVVEYSTDGSSWNALTFPAQPTSATWRLVTITGGTIPATSNLRLRWTNSTTAEQFRIDDIILTGDVAAGPNLSANTLTSFGAQCINAGPYGPNSFTITGSSLTTADVTVGALSGFTYSTSALGTYTSSLTLSQPGGPYSQAIFVKFDPTAVQSYSGNIAVGGGGASSINVAASGSGVNTAPVVTTGAASALTISSATVAGTLNTTGICGSVTAYGIEYSTTAAFANGTGTPIASTNLSGTAFSSALSGLAPCTIYYTHAYATRASGTTYGTEGTFTTSAIAAPTATAGTSVGSADFTANWGAVTGATGYKLDVSTSATFGTSTPGTSTTETFTGIGGGTTSSYLTRIWTGVHGVGWTAFKTRTDQVVFTGNDAITLQDAAGAYLISDPISGGVSAISFDVKLVFSGTSGTVTVSVLSGVGFATSTPIGTVTYTPTASVFSQTFTDIAGPIKIRLDNTTISTRPAIDNLTFTRVAVNVPDFVTGYNNLSVAGTSQLVSGLSPLTTYYYRVRTVGPSCTSVNSNVINVTTGAGVSPTLTAGTLADFGSLCQGSSSAPQSFTVEAFNLTTADVTVGALAGYAYSTTELGSYTATLSIPQPGGNFTQDIWVVFTPAAAQNYDGNITVGGGGATDITVAVTGNGIATPSAVSTGTASQTGDDSAEAFGSIDAEGCFATTAYGIEYSQTPGFTPGTGTQVASGNLVGGSFSSMLTGLDLCTDYYFRAYLTNSQGTIHGDEETFTNTDITAPTATAATGILVDGFTANWDAVAAATGYFLDVSTSPTFGTPLSSTTVSTGFDGGRASLPAGWSNTGLGTDYTSDGGVAFPSLKFDSSTDQLVSPLFPGAATSVSYWYKGQGTAGSASALLTEGYNGSVWVAIGTLTSIPSSATGTVTYPLNINDGFVQFRFTFTKSSGNLAFDDASITYMAGTPDLLPGYDALPVAGTSQVVNGLNSNTTYYYRVRANSGCGASLNSNVINVTTLTSGCTDPLAQNYLPGAVPDNGTCTYCAPTYTYNTPSPTPITIGTGIPDQNMAVAVDCHTFKVALNAYARFVGPIVPAGNVYTTTAGYSPTSTGNPTPDPNNARWNFLVSIDLDTFDFTEVNVYLDMDFDDGVTPVYQTVDISALAIAQGQGASHIQQQAQNLKSAFWSSLFPGVSFDATVAGTYDLRVRIESPTTGAPLWSHAIQVVVEAPGCMDPLADNYNANASTDDGSCTYCVPTITYNAPTPTPITIGTGIPDQNMAVSQDCRGIDVALNAYARYVGAIVPTGNIYTTTTGNSPVSGSDPTPDPVLARWNVLGSVDLGAYDFTQVNVFLDLDFDPGATPVWHTLNLSQTMIDNSMGGQHVYQASENLAAPFWTIAFPGVTFDPHVAGIYDVRVRLASTGSGEELVSMSIQIVVEQTCTPHTGNAWYVNDASLVGDVYTTAAGSDSNTGTIDCPFGSIAHAIDQASAGDTILVDAGVYVQDLVVTKPVDLRGAQYNADPNIRTGAESVLYPATSDADPTSATAVVLIYLDDNAASGTKINGFTMDGDNPGLTSGVVINGADVDAIEGIASYTGNANLDIAFNVVRNFTYAGVELDNYTGVGSLSGNTVRNNLLTNMNSASWGLGIFIQYNLYADITDNTFKQVRIGIQTGNQILPNLGTPSVISGNTITSYRLGIFHNVQYTTATPFTIANNELLTEVGATTNTGIFIGVLDPTTSVTIQNNNVTGAENGIMLWGSNSTGGITIEGGTLTDCGTGVFVNNYDAYPPGPDQTRSTTAIVKDVTIVNAGIAGIHAKDNQLNSNAAATVHVDIEGTTTVNVANGAVNVLVTGAKASASFAGSDVDLTGTALRHIRLQSNGSTLPAGNIDATQVKFNGATATTATGFTIEDLIDHKVDLIGLGKVSFVPGEVFVTVNSFVAPNTAGSVQRGIDASVATDIVHVNDGTYNEDVNVNKAITLQGNDRDLTILRGLYSTTVAALNIGANVTVKDLTSTRDFGVNTADWQASPKVNGVTFMGNNSTMDNVRATGHRNGVYINNRQNVHVINSIIEANRTGIQVGNNVSGTEIRNNFIQDNFTMGFLFNFDLSGTPNTTGMVVSENSITGNWYGEVSYQGTPTSAVSGADFSCNWYGTPSPVVSATLTGEPGYASQVPSQFGGTAPAPPAGQIMGVSAALVPYEPFGATGTDDQPGTPGWQPVAGNCEVVYYSQASGNVSDPIWDIVPVGTAGPATFTASTSMVVQNTHAVVNTSNTDAKNVTVETGGTLTLNGSTGLSVHGDAALFTGTLIAADLSTLSLLGTDATTLGSSSALNLWNLTVNTPANASTVANIKIRGTLQIDAGDFDASTGQLTLVSTATGTGRLGPVLGSASYTGSMTVQRYIPGGHTNWRFLGSPVAGRTVNDWQDDFITAGYPGSQFPNFDQPVGSGIRWPSIRQYLETNAYADADSGIVGVISNTQALTVGQGFLAWSGNNFTTTNPFTVDVTGEPTIAYVPVPLPMSYTSSGDNAADGWNLVSNPLPSAIDFESINRDTDVPDQYWVFNPVTGTHQSYSGGIGQGGVDGTIQSSQAFWLKANGANYNTSVSESAKVNDLTGGVFGGSEQAVRPILRLTVASTINTYSDEATVVFDQGTPDLDAEDAPKFSFHTIGAPQVAAQAPNGDKLAIDFFGAYTSAITIPVTVDVEVTGTYTINAGITGMNNLSCLTLEDLQTGTITPLTDGTSYSFSINAADDANTPRFLLHGSAPLPFYAQNATCANSPNGLAAVVIGNGPVDVTWMDAFGNVLGTLTGLSNVVAINDELAAGNYTVKVSPIGVCGSVAADFSIEAPAEIAGSLTNSTTTSCPNSSDGSVSVEGNGGTGELSYIWNDGTIGTTFTGVAGVHQVTITDANGCATTESYTVPAGDGAIASFTNGTAVAGQPVAFTNTSTSSNAWIWDFGDGNSSTDMDAVHTYAAAGTYTVTLTATDGSCNDVTTQTTTVDLATAITPLNGTTTLNVYATPQQLVIDHPFGNAPVDITVYDATGRQVMNRDGVVKPERITLSDRILNTGVWFVRVKSGDTERTFRVPLVR